ncbi:hypothetical protein Tco_0755940 [Tanacetum coccineum]
MERRSVKVNELQERCIIKAFKLKNQERYEYVSPKVTSSQRLQYGEKRLCLVDDLKKFKITFMSSQSLKSMITISYSQDEVMKNNPTPSDLVVESPSPSPIPCGDSNSLMEKIDTLFSHFNDSLPNYEIFCFDIKEKRSDSTISHSDHSLPDYEAFCFDVDHIKEKSSGSTTSHSDLSLLEYESFHFDFSIDPLFPSDRSDSHHEEFADELAHIISSLEYYCFYFDIEPEPGELSILFEENISEDSTKELTSPKLNDFPLLLSDCNSTFSEEFFEIDLLVSLPSGNKDKIFNLEIFIIKGVQSKRFHILSLDDFPTISFVSDSLFLIDPSAIETFLSFPFGNEDKVFDPGILLIDGIFSFTRKSPLLLINNFMIDKCHILSEISLMTESLFSFLPKDN